MKSLGWFEASLYIPEESSDMMGQVSVAVEAKVFDRGNERHVPLWWSSLSMSVIILKLTKSHYHPWNLVFFTSS